MARRPVLIDTWALIALINRAEMLHGKAVAVSGRLRKQKRVRVVTEWTLTEFLGGAAKQPLRDFAVQMIDQLRQSPTVQIIPADSADWQLGFDLYKSRPDKEWSMVDCISILLCQRLGITDVFSADRHFEQAGLQILIR
jgi:predicted nucleic acid-binding protein